MAQMREQQTNLKQTPQASANNKPVMQYRAGVISVSLWENEGKVFDGKASTFLTASVQRSYKDKADQWQHTATFRANDLPVLAMLLNDAFADIKKKKLENSETE